MRLRVWLLAAAVGCVPAAAQSSVNEQLWVLTESEQIFSLDTRTLTLDTTPIELGNFTYTTPTCLTFSSTRGGPVAFVAHGSFVRMVDVATESVLAHSIHVASLLGVPEIQLKACGAAAPRRFDSGSTSLTRSHLFLAGNLPGGEARWIVLDQAAAIAGTTPVLVAAGRLHAGAEVHDVMVLDAPQGEGFQRAWYTLSRFDAGNLEIVNLELRLPKDLRDRATLGKARTLTLPTAGVPLDGLGVGVSRDGKVPVQPGSVSGRLEHLETGDGCTIPGSPTALSVHGPGPNSYSVFALDPLAADVVAVDPNNCATVAFDVGAGPVALIPRRELVWDGLFVLDHVGDSISFLEPDGDIVQVPLFPGAGPVGGGIAQSLPCAAENLMLDKSGDDIVLTWEAVGCADDVEFSAWCNCVDDDPNCPCACDCTVPSQDPDCACPFAEAAIGFGAKAFRGGIDGLLLDYNPGDLPTTNPWKKLEATPNTSIDHQGVLDEGSWFYLINESDEPPGGDP